MSGSSKSSSTRDITPKDIEQFRKGLEGVYNTFLSSGGAGGADVAALAPDLASPVTGTEQGLLDRLLGYAGTSEAESAALSNLTATLRGDFLDPNNPTLQGYVEAAQRPILKQAQQAELSARSTFTRAGQNIQSSSPYATAYADLQGSLFNALKDSAAQILYPAFQSERENQIAATNLAPQVLASIADRNLKILEAEGLPRLVSQQGITNALTEIDSRRDALAQALASAAGLAAPVTGTRSHAASGGIL